MCWAVYILHNSLYAGLKMIFFFITEFNFACMLIISHLNIHLVSRIYQFFLEHIILTENTTKKNVCDDVKKVREKAAVGGGRRRRLWCFAIHSSARDENDVIDFKENVCLSPHGTQKKRLRVLFWVFLHIASSLARECAHNIIHRTQHIQPDTARGEE